MNDSWGAGRALGCGFSSASLSLFSLSLFLSSHLFLLYERIDDKNREGERRRTTLNITTLRTPRCWCSARNEKIISSILLASLGSGETCRLVTTRYCGYRQIIPPINRDESKRVIPPSCNDRLCLLLEFTYTKVGVTTVIVLNARWEMACHQRKQSSNCMELRVSTN